MGVSAPAAGKTNGLATVVSVLTAPVEAFQTLREAPTWGWAFVVALVLTAVGQYLGTPAVVHALVASWPAQIAASPQLAGQSPQAQQAALNVSVAIVRWAWIAAPLIVLVNTLVFTIVMLIFKAGGGGESSFKQLWCAAMNVCVVAVGIAALLSGLIALTRGAATYATTADAYRSIPSLAWFVPAAPLKTAAFLAGFNVVSIWAAVLIALAMVHVAKTSKGAGAACALVILCAGSGFLAWGAR